MVFKNFLQLFSNSFIFLFIIIIYYYILGLAELSQKHYKQAARHFLEVSFDNLDYSKVILYYLFIAYASVYIAVINSQVVVRFPSC